MIKKELNSINICINKNTSKIELLLVLFLRTNVKAAQ